MNCVVHGVTKSRTRLSDFKERRLVSGSINIGWLVFAAPTPVPPCYAPPDTHLTYPCVSKDVHTEKSSPALNTVLLNPDCIGNTWEALGKNKQHQSHTWDWLNQAFHVRDKYRHQGILEPAAPGGSNVQPRLIPALASEKVQEGAKRYGLICQEALRQLVLCKIFKYVWQTLLCSSLCFQGSWCEVIFILGRRWYGVGLGG